jgi:hypothetical protein
MQHIVDEINKHAQQKITSVMPFTFYSRIRKWQGVTVGKMYGISALFTLMRILQKPTQMSYYSKNCLIFTPFFSQAVPLERLEFTVRFLHFIDNSTENEYQVPARLFKIYPVV